MHQPPKNTDSQENLNFGVFFSSVTQELFSALAATGAFKKPSYFQGLLLWYADTHHTTRNTSSSWKKVFEAAEKKTFFQRPSRGTQTKKKRMMEKRHLCVLVCVPCENNSHGFALWNEKNNSNSFFDGQQLDQGTGRGEGVTFYAIKKQHLLSSSIVMPSRINHLPVKLKQNLVIKLILFVQKIPCHLFLFHSFCHEGSSGEKRIKKTWRRRRRWRPINHARKCCFLPSLLLLLLLFCIVCCCLSFVHNNNTNTLS